MVFIGFSLHTFSWLLLKLLPPKKILTGSRFFFFFIFIAHFLLRACAKFTSFINLVHLITCSSLHLCQPNMSTLLLCILYQSNSFQTERITLSDLTATLRSRLKIAIPHIPFGSLAWHFRLISYIDILLVDVRSFKNFVDLSCPKSCLKGLLNV